jgi:multidrug resistance efflux pump
MEIEIYSAFVEAGIAPDKAKAAVDSISKEIDKRYALHSAQLATRGDIEGVRKDVADLRAEVAKAIAESQRWTITAMFGAVGLFAVISKVWH